MLTSAQFSIGTTSSELSGHSVQSSRVTVTNHEHGAGKRVWLGPGLVTTSTGMLLGSEPFTFYLHPMEHLHAVTDSGTVLIGVITQKI